MRHERKKHTYISTSPINLCLFTAPNKDGLEPKVPQIATDEQL